MSAWVLVRNPDWWGWRDHPGNVDRVEWTHMPNGERRLEALLSGEIDFLPDPPIDGLERIRRTPGLKLAETWLPRVVYLGLNQGSEELHTSDVKGKNPFKDKRVRQALYQAIDVDAIRDKALRGLGVPTSMLVTPAVAGYIEELDRLPYDPARAKALLDEAGYADGFAVRLDCPQSRFEGPAVCSEIAQQLGKIGVRVSVDLLSEHAATRGSTSGPPTCTYRATIPGRWTLWRSCGSITAGRRNWAPPDTPTRSSTSSSRRSKVRSSRTAGTPCSSRRGRSCGTTSSSSPSSGCPRSGRCARNSICPSAQISCPTSTTRSSSR